MIDTLLIATHNQGKVVEFDTLLSGMGITLKSAADFDLVEPEETETTFVGNALLKARAASKVAGIPCLADDSGICINALDGAPGIYSARWAQKPDGSRDFSYAMEQVNAKIGGIDGTQSAYFVAVLALVYPDGKEVTFEGRIEGKLCWPPRGDKGFGYDPIFIADGQDITFGEMDSDKKQAMSHRTVAVAQLKAHLYSNV